MLLSAIYAAWDSPEPRLVYADWLEDRGDPRGELIQLQCRWEAAGRESDERDSFRRREREVRQQAERAWFGDFYDPRLTLEFDRGIAIGLTHTDMFVEVVNSTRVYGLRFLPGGVVKGGPAYSDWVFNPKWTDQSQGGTYRLDASDSLLSLAFELEEDGEDEFYVHGERVSMSGDLVGPGPVVEINWRGLVTGNSGTRSFQLLSHPEFVEALAGNPEL